MPLSVQPKLLRVLQEYELERVGSTEKIHLDIRVVAATNRNLKELIQEGKFREDLYYRISVINLTIPPPAGTKGRHSAHRQALSAAPQAAHGNSPSDLLSPG